jgi:predicted enzyme related to lactoylglutathione lyase
VILLVRAGAGRGHRSRVLSTSAVAIVTGGSRGRGRAIARALAADGYAVVVVYLRDQAAAEALVDEIVAADGTALAVRADVTDELDVERLFAETLDAFGGVDVVVHAGDVDRSTARQLARALRSQPKEAVPVDMKLEVVILPVSDVDRAKEFYASTLGWRLDADFSTGPDFRVVQVTPPGSPTSCNFGTDVTDAEPGSIASLILVVDDIEAARAEIAGRGVEVSEVFHDAGGVFVHGGTRNRVDGPDPEHGSYGSWASFSDPDGNGWLLQEITERLPGR